jgi:ribonuclease VapC
MIAVDTSALMAIVRVEQQAAACAAALNEDDEIVISAGTLAEALIVAGRQGFAQEMTKVIDGLEATVVPVTEAVAQRMAQTYSRWGRGVHPASLNFGDCFAYDVAKQHGCKLLFIGKDFAKTDIEGVL